MTHTIISGYFSPPDGLHHAGITQLSRAQLTVKGQGLLVLIGFDAAHKERLAETQSAHQSLQRPPELDAESRGLPASIPGL